MKPNRDAYAAELTRALDALEALEGERKSANAEFNARKEKLLERVKNFRDLLSGRRGAQEEMVLLAGDGDGKDGGK